MGGAVRKHHSSDASFKTTEQWFTIAERSVWNTVIGHGAQTMSKESSISVLIRHMALRALAFLSMTVLTFAALEIQKTKQITLMHSPV